MLVVMLDKTKVLYNGSCPICSKEINHYKAHSQDVDYQDLNNCNLDYWRVDKQTAMKRLHVEHNGNVYVGMDAFIKLWQTMPRYKPLATLASMPGLYHLGKFTYDWILAPVLYKINS